jgi:flagellar P-ring protein precursor FlgI
MTNVATAANRLKTALRAVVLAATTLSTLLPAPAHSASRIKELVEFEGVRENLLVGYGLVVGLNGKGDKLNNAPFTKESLNGMLERLGVNIRDKTGTISNLDPKNVAAVMVTGVLPPFARQGARIDVNVAAMGDASELKGGILLVTPLIGADGEVYAVAQGNVQSNGFQVSGASGSSVVKGVPTTARVPNGAVVERELPFEMSHMESVKLNLRTRDFTTARRIAEAVNSFLGSDLSRPIDPATVQLTVPPAYKGNVVALLTDVEQLKVEPDQVAKVIIDDATGTIVMGENVRISTVAIAQGNLTIRITETPQVSQPSPFSSTGTTTTVQRSDIQVDEGGSKKLDVMNHGVTLRELVDNMNSLGLSPRDMIPILQAIKAAGALQADLEVL